MYDQPQSRAQSSAERTRRAHPCASSLDGDRKRQSGLPAAEADDRVGVRGLERTSRLAAVFGPWTGPRPYGIGLGGVGTQSPGVASVLTSEAQRTADRGSDCTESSLKPDAVLQRWCGWPLELGCSGVAGMPKVQASVWPGAVGPAPLRSGPCSA